MDRLHSETQPLKNNSWQKALSSKHSTTKKKKEEGCFYSENPPGFITIPQCRVGREKVKSFIIGTLCTYCIIWEF
jgi:hypothetical protein